MSTPSLDPASTGGFCRHLHTTFDHAVTLMRGMFRASAAQLRLPYALLA